MAVRRSLTTGRNEGWQIRRCSSAAGWPIRCRWGPSFRPPTHSAGASCDTPGGRRMRRCWSSAPAPAWFSRALLEGGVPAERLIVVEIVPEMARHLRRVLPGVLVIEGDARLLPSLLARHWHGRIGSVVCGIPLVLLPT